MLKFLSKNNYNYFKNYSLNKLTTIKNNGKTKYVVFIKNIEELLKLLDFLDNKKIKYLLIGNGSKLIFIKTYKGIIISLRKLNKIIINNNYVEVEAGAIISELINKIKINHLGGIEPLIGIPSSIGGALVNNSSAHNVSLYDYLEKVLVIKNNKLIYLNKKDISFSYRYSNLKDNYIILKAYFKFKGRNILEINNDINFYLNYRKINQEIKYPNIGSIFKNNNEYKAVDLIKKCNLEDYKYKNVQLSKKHLNFLKIRKKTKGKNIFIFVKKIKKIIKKRLNIELKEEIIFIK